MDSKTLAITMGDPAGIGPEVCLMLLKKAASVAPEARPIIYGDRKILELVSSATGLPMPRPENIRQIDSLPEPEAVVPGKVDHFCGQAAFDYVIAAIDDALSGAVDAIVTAPINKAALHAARIEYPGHTEILAERTKSERSCMLQYSAEMTASFVTCHCGYADVPLLLTRERLREVINLTSEALSKIKKRPARLLALGLNPHSGEDGLFGNREEESIIIPELEEARLRGIDIFGPVAPDTAFLPDTRASTDAYICMYHDQGHIPLKVLAFDSAVNVTLGLPIVRTSVDHGTAFDIAWKGQANPGSMLSATRLALQLISQNDS